MKKRRGKIRCPHCGSSRIIKAGKKRNKYVTKHGYRCKDCRRFVERDGFENRTYPGEIIALVLHLYVEGLSLSKIREIVDQHHGYRPADSTILDWVRSGRKESTKEAHVGSYRHRQYNTVGRPGGMGQ